MVIFLIGFMGCGKSTIGRRVAERLGFEFWDMDAIIEELAGMSISELFATQGENEFRKLESWLIGQVQTDENLIVATGGGAPCSGNNMERMKAKGMTVYFKMTPEQLVGRLSRGRARRPKIAGMNDEELLNYTRLTLVEREKFYLQASVVIDCNGVNDQYIAEHLMCCTNMHK